MIPSHGAPAGSPRLPSATRISTRRRDPSAASRARADAASVGWRSMRGHARAERGEDRRLVARARPDLEDPVARADLEELGHPGDHERLADRLAGVDRAGPRRRRRCRRSWTSHEALARDRAHRREDPLVADAASAQLVGDHPPRRDGRARRSSYRPAGRPCRRGYARGAPLRTGWARRSVRPTGGDADGLGAADGLADADADGDAERAGRAPMRSATPTSSTMPTSSRLAVDDRGRRRRRRPGEQAAVPGEQAVDQDPDEDDDRRDDEDPATALSVTRTASSDGVGARVVAAGWPRWRAAAPAAAPATAAVAARSSDRRPLRSSSASSSPDPSSGPRRCRARRLGLEFRLGRGLGLGAGSAPARLGLGLRRGSGSGSDARRASVSAPAAARPGASASAATSASVGRSSGEPSGRSVIRSVSLLAARAPCRARDAGASVPKAPSRRPSRVAERRHEQPGQPGHHRRRARRTRSPTPTPTNSARTDPSAIAIVIEPNTSANRKPTTRPISVRRRPLLEERLARDDEDHVRDALPEREADRQRRGCRSARSATIRPQTA